MKCLAVCEVTGLILEKSPHKFLGLNLINAESPRPFVDNPDFINEMGIIGAGLLENRFGLAYWKTNTTIADIYHDPNLAKPETYVKLLKYTFSTFERFLWFAKDNAVSGGVSFAETKEWGNKDYFVETVYDIHSNSAGEWGAEFFSSKNLAFCNSIRSQYYSKCIPGPKQKKTLTKNKGSVLVFDITGAEGYNESDRITRAIQFINIARKTHYLPAKIALYMAVLESLFSTESSEVTQKVCERVSFYVSRNKAERFDIFELLTFAYGLRSKYVHGGEYDNKHLKPDKIKETSVFVDKICRKVLIKIITKDSAIFIQKKDPFGLFLKKLIFAKNI